VKQRNRAVSVELFKGIAGIRRGRKLRKFLFDRLKGQGGEIGRRARLRIPKSSISQRSFSFQKTSDLRGKNAVFGLKANLYEGRVETSSF
jgi:hypothetical protein